MKNIAKISFLLLSTKLKRTLSFLCLLALLSVTAGLVGNTILSTDAIDPIHIAIVDLDQSAETELLYGTVLSSLDEDSLLRIKKTDEKEASRLLQAGEVAAVFIIPQDFFQSILRGENKPFGASYNPNTPLQSGLLDVLLNQVLTILKASQSGIYAALDYTNEQAPEQYFAMHLAINARYINAVLLHDQIVDAKEISATGSVNSGIFYLFSALLFLLTLSCSLFSPLIRQRFSPPVLAQLERQNHPESDIVGGWILGMWGWFSLLGTVIFIAYSILSSFIMLPTHFLLLPALLVFLLCLSVFSVLIGFLVPKPTDCMAVISICSVLSLFFSGGLIPLHFLPQFFSKIALFFPQYWALALVQSALSGKFPPLACSMLLLFSFLFFAATVFHLKQQNKKVTR